MSLLNHQSFVPPPQLDTGLGKAVTGQLTESQDIHLRCLSLLEAVASTANRSDNPLILLQMAVELICTQAGFQAGNALIRKGLAGETELHGCNAAFVPERAGGQAFADACNRFTTWACATAPGRLLLDAESACELAIDSSASFSRSAEAREAGLRTLIAIPVQVDHQVEAVLEFFSEHEGSVAPQLVDVLLLAAREIAFVFIRARKEENLRKDALVDRLTGLPNRAQFEAGLRDSFEKAHSNGRVGPTLIFVDIDGLKLVNDMYGNDAGDSLIEAMASRIQRVVLEFGAAERLFLHHVHEIMLARLSGGEFTVMIEGPDQQKLAAEIADELHRSLAVAHLYGKIPIRITASVGIASDDGHYAHAHELLRDADAAMGKAKAEAKSKTVIFDTPLRMAALDALRIEAELRHAIDRHQFEMHYQPIFSMNSRQIVGIEALVRWRRSFDDLVTPDRFMGVAKDKGLIGQIGEQALRQACRALRQIEALQMGETMPFVSVNISSTQLLAPEFPELVESIIYETGITPGLLTLEVTETAAISSLQRTADSLKRLRKFGIRVELDDFGTGYSSLSHLQNLEFDGIKIDKSFVIGQAVETSNWSIATAIMQMAKAVGVRVTAEGIETAFQFEKLQELGCDFGQGFLLGYPLELSRVITLLQAQSAQPFVLENTG